MSTQPMLTKQGSHASLLKGVREECGVGRGGARVVFDFCGCGGISVRARNATKRPDSGSQR